MAVGVILNFSGGTAGQYDRVIEKMGLGGRLPEGALFHAAGEYEAGWRVVDVWESMPRFQAFAEVKIAPLSAAEGLPEPEIRMFEVDELFDERDGGTGDIGLVQLVFLPGMTREAFRDADGDIRDNGAPPDGCMFHVNGPFDGGWIVMDGWTTKEVRDAFVVAKIAPAMQSRGMTPPDIEDLMVHNTLPSGVGAAA